MKAVEHCVLDYLGRYLGSQGPTIYGLVETGARMRALRAI